MPRVLMLTCIDCRIEKPDSEFYDQPGASTGKDKRCMKCKCAFWKKQRTETKAKLAQLDAAMALIADIARDESGAGSKCAAFIGCEHLQSTQ